MLGNGITTVLRGAKFRPQAAQIKLLTVEKGDPLNLVPEPDNRFDPNAIKVYIPPKEGEEVNEESDFVGYIAREDCEDVLSFIEAINNEPGTSLRVEVSAVNGQAPGIAVIMDFDSDDGSPPQAA